MRCLDGVGRRMVALLVLLCLLLPLAGCVSLPEPQYDTRLNFLSDTGVSVFRVVYPEDAASEEVVAAADSVRDVMAALLDADVSLVTDNSSAEAPDLFMPYEVLIGDTARKETRSVLSQLGADEWAVRLIGHKIVVVGETNRATLEAVDHFVTKVLGVEDGQPVTVNRGLKIELDYEYEGRYRVAAQESAKQSAALQGAPYRASVLYPVPISDSASHALAIATLQGLAAATGSEQIVWRDAAYDAYMPLLAEQGEVVVEEHDDRGNDWTLASLLHRYREQLDGYLLCSAPKGESACVAVTLAHHLNAVVVTPEVEPLAISAGLMCLMDVSGKDDAWLRASEYFSLLDTSVAVEQSAANAPALIDYAVMRGAYCYFYDGNDPYAHAQQFKFLDRGACVLLGTEVGNPEVVSLLSDIGLQAVDAGHLSNLSTLSGYGFDGGLAQQAPGQVSVQERHTVCFIMSDGGDLQQMLQDYTVGKSWYGGAQRGEYALSWTLSPALYDVAAPVLEYLDASATVKDDFLLRLPAPRYTYQADWQLELQHQLARRVASAMARMGTDYLQLPPLPYSAEMYELLMQQPQIRGLISLDMLPNSYQMGDITRVLDKPLVSARYRLTAQDTDLSPASIVQSLNAASRDACSPGAYSLIVIDSNAGLDDQDNIVEGGDPMALVGYIAEHLDDHVDVVTVSEFMARIDQNLQ